MATKHRPNSSDKGKSVPAPHFLIHSPKDNVGVIVVENLRAGTQMLGVITERGHPDRTQGRPQAVEEGRYRDQVRRRYRQDDCRRHHRQARARAESKDQALVKGTSHAGQAHQQAQ